MKTVCAWCLKEQEVLPKKGDSHGICDRHFKIEIAKMDEHLEEKSLDQISLEDLNSDLEEIDD